MSNSKYRPAAAEAMAREPNAESAKAGASLAERVPVPGDDDWVWEKAIEDPVRYMKVLKQMLRDIKCAPNGFESPLSEERVRWMLEGGMELMSAIVNSTTAIMRTIPLEGLRRICGGDIPCIGGAMFDEPVHADPKKRPRGSSHPLMRLISLAIQADRLMLATAKVLFPDMARSVVAERNRHFQELNRAADQLDRAYDLPGIS